MNRAPPFGLVLALACAACSAAVAGGCSKSAGPSAPPAKTLTHQDLLDPLNCQGCHAEHYGQWSGSMHAYAADDPLFRAMNARAQRETNGAIGTFCVKCHAPVAVLTGATKTGLDLDQVPVAQRGVTCYFCHSVNAVNGASDNPLQLANDDVLRGGIANPVETAAHASAYSDLHDRDQPASSTLCGACHDVALASNNLPIEQTYAEWQGSLYSHASTKTLLTCGGCHMNGTQGLAANAPNVVPTRTVHDHSVPGVDLALTAFPEADAQAGLVQQNLDPAIVTKLCVQPPSTGDTVSVTLDNAFVGHNWPSGAVHDRRAWVELVASANGKVIFQSGVTPDDQTSVESIHDPNLWVLKESLLDSSQNPVLFMWEAASAQAAALPVAVTNIASDPRYYHSVTRSYPVPPEADDITMRVRMAPVALEVVDSLIASGDLDPSYRAKLPVFTLAGSKHEWKTANGYGCAP